jgi:hypothetical protein
VSDIREDEETLVPLMWFMQDRKVGCRLKTKTSERVVPVHPQLTEIGFLNYVAERRKEGEQAWLFPTVAPDQNLWMALEWIAMEATYNEVRLVNAMTALGNLVSSNTRDTRQLLDDKLFARLKAALTTTIKEFA